MSNGAVNDWNTPAPDLSEVKPTCDALAAQGFDMHTVKVELNNGGWIVEIFATDSDLQDHCFEFDLNRYGALVRI